MNFPDLSNYIYTNHPGASNGPCIQMVLHTYKWSLRDHLTEGPIVKDIERKQLEWLKKTENWRKQGRPRAEWHKAVKIHERKESITWIFFVKIILKYKNDMFYRFTASSRPRRSKYYCLCLVFLSYPTIWLLITRTIISIIAFVFIGTTACLLLQYESILVFLGEAHGARTMHVLIRGIDFREEALQETWVGQFHRDSCSRSNQLKKGCTHSLSFSFTFGYVWILLLYNPMSIYTTMSY